MTVRCKFICQEVSTSVAATTEGRLYGAKFYPVYAGSDENKKFWAATPSGSLLLGTLKEMPFVVGKEYYLDVSEV